MTDAFDELSQTMAKLGPEGFEARLKHVAEATSGRKVFTTSLGIEDQCITHAIFTQDLDIEVVTLDTGRLFPETYDLWAKTEAQYEKRITPYNPNHDDVQELVAEIGINGFYESLAFRKDCCHVRKVEPLNRALKDAKIWITGIRGTQTAGRQSMNFVEPDTSRGLVKVNPLLDWSNDVLNAYVKDNNVPINELHGKGYPSIGCQPCTRAIEPGEDERAGRWWWENENDEAGQECGLHVGPDGRLVRTSTA